MMPGKEFSHEQPEASVELVPYDVSWVAQFESERQSLDRILSHWLVGPIEHVGSTAVPGLAAKPVIDIMAPVLSLEASRPAIDAIVNAGYVHAPYRADVMHWFCKPSPAYRTHHLHLVPYGSVLWGDRLAFRDALRRSPTSVAEYAALKQTLAIKFQRDREAYTAAKSSFVQRVLSRSTAGA